MKRKTFAKNRQIAEQELDGVYFLKLVMYVIVGAQWLRFTDMNGTDTFSLPIGLIIGVVFALHDHFRIDRKIEFAVLLITALVGYYAGIGLSFTL